LTKGETPGRQHPADWMQTDAPFEWLTNFRSLRHLVLPSRVAYGNSSSKKESNTNNGHVEQLSLNALHVGCGTSAVGESLACLRESTHDGLGAANRYGYVLNVDNDICALNMMQRRWEDRQLLNDEQNQEGELVGRMEWKCLDFDNDESCRSVMDDVYRRILTQSTTTTVDQIACNDEQLGGCFDLVLDKSTLDCLLCAETEIVARFFCEVYRALKPSCNTVSSNHHRLGGVYILVTFHPAEFIMKLLNDLPGADWTVEYEVIKREIEEIKLVNTVCSIENLEDDKSNNTTQTFTENKASASSSSAWQSSGTFEPNENYRRTITVFTCRRDSPVKSKKDEGMSSLLQPSYMLDMEQVRMHIEQTCDDWYKATNPMVTNERVVNIRTAFVNETVLKLHDDTNEVILDLKTCYHILFTDSEKEHLDYDHFLEDWDAYYNDKYSDNESIRCEGMTVEIALDFLKEMQ
jgi:hypothetical protein